jgi:predicted RND superfamily exporter protein
MATLYGVVLALEYAFTQSLPSIIEFIIIVIIGVIVAYGVATVLRRALSLKYFEQYPK